jgi:hypothetical protein
MAFSSEDSRCAGRAAVRLSSVLSAVRSSPPILHRAAVAAAGRGRLEGKVAAVTGGAAGIGEVFPAAVHRAPRMGIG